MNDLDQAPGAGPPVMVGLRRLYASGRIRIFLNATRLDPYHARDVAAWRRVAVRFRPDDYLAWMTHWHADRAYFQQAAEFYRGLSMPLDHVWVLGNTQAETQAAREAGFSSAWVNHNAWLDETRFYPRPANKEFRAVMVCQLAPYKRIYLATKVKGLALVPSALFRLHEPTSLSGLSDATVLAKLPSDQVPAVLARSHAGLILSAEEGACYASSEYLLSGLPVVSTPSLGGRDVFYTAENACVVDPDPDAVARGVEQVIARAPDPWSIHRAHVEQSLAFRTRFADEVLGTIFQTNHITDAPRVVLSAIFQHKMISYVSESNAMALVD